MFEVRRSRGFAQLCVVSVFLLLGSLLLQGARAEVASAGSFSLSSGSTNATDWIVVSANHSVHWRTGSDVYMGFWVEIEELGVLASVDNDGVSGCAWTTDSIHFRLRWVNPDGLTQAPSTAHVNFSIEIMPDPGSCQSALDMARQNQASRPAVTSQPSMLAMAAVGGCIVGLVAVAWWLQFRDDAAQRGRK